LICAVDLAERFLDFDLLDISSSKIHEPLLNGEFEGKKRPSKFQNTLVLSIKKIPKIISRESALKLSIR
jgi:hypothetical protein